MSRLIDHMRWADSLVADALERDVPPEPEALRLFAHIASVEHLWYSRIEARAPVHAVWPSFTIDGARSLAAEHADLFAALLADGTEAALARTVAYRNSAGLEFASAVGDIITHVAMHGSYHRGQIARQLRRAGRVPPYTDYIQFTRRSEDR
jgi:uncharacterized damage-inducible protein DinB